MKRTLIAAAALVMLMHGCAAVADMPADIERARVADEQDQEDTRRAHAEHVAEFCTYHADKCTDGMPHPGALPAYSEACGYLPPILGDDC